MPCSSEVFLQRGGSCATAPLIPVLDNPVDLEAEDGEADLRAEEVVVGMGLRICAMGRDLSTQRLCVHPSRQRKCTAMLGPATSVTSSINNASMRLRSNALIRASFQTRGVARQVDDAFARRLV